MTDLETLDRKVIALTHDLVALKEQIAEMQLGFNNAFGCMDKVNKEIGRIKTKLPKDEK